MSLKALNVENLANFDLNSRLFELERHMTSIYHEFGFDQLADWMRKNGLKRWADILPDQATDGLSQKRFGDLKNWLSALHSMPEVGTTKFIPGASVCVEANHLNNRESEQLQAALEGLIPWRKGPYDLCGTYIDTEWRSDWKWDRLKEAIKPLEGRLVLDVGCGNGYHMWRMLEQNPARVIGIDPSPRFSVQFEMVKRLAGKSLPIDLVPTTLEAVPSNLEAFDSVFSMGVLYHRREPVEHIRELKGCLRPGGELLLESLIVASDDADALVPDGRYAKMRNVWILPSIKMMKAWLEDAGFINVRMVNESTTTIKEQRSTDWMRFESLPDFLDPKDPNKTIEGYPAPRRGIVLAEKPLK